MSFIESVKKSVDLHKPNIRQLLSQESDRINNCLAYSQGIELDYSRQAISQTQFNDLVQLLNQSHLQNSINALFSGEKLNNTEDRAALHTELRSQKPRVEIVQCKTQISEITDRLHSGKWQGSTGKNITDVINLGIGGSDLGPRMVRECLIYEKNPNIRVHYVSNIDSKLETLTSRLDPTSTVFIISSKSWSTIETLHNAERAINWLTNNGLSKEQAMQQCIAITSKVEQAQQYGIPTENILPLWDWVGGRFSLWSAVGLSIAIATSYQHFEQLLAGAESMDQHFKNTPFDKNIPVILSLLEIWNTNILGASSLAIIPYSFKLRLLTHHLQQLIMESNGKRVAKNGEALSYNTSPIIWGNAGTVGQHSYHQLLHQGTQDIPVDFILPVADPDILDKTQYQLVANCLAQSQALVDGADYPNHELAAHKNMPGNRPNNIISLDKVDAFHVGALIAMYEHKVFTSSVLWDINAFDQWGVERGKIMANEIFEQLSNKQFKNSGSANQAYLQRHFNK